MNATQKPHILIEIGEVDQIIGSPSYGQNKLDIQIVGLDNASALNLVNTLHTSLLKEVIRENQAMQKRIVDLTKMSLDK